MQNTIFSLITNRAFQTFFILVSYLIFAPYIPRQIQQGFYTISLFIKDILVLIVPFMVCIFIANTVRSFEKKAPLFIITLVIFELISNSCSVWYAFLGGHLISSNIDSFAVNEVKSGFTALWRLPLIKPAWWTADKGSLVGLITGCLAAFCYQNKNIDLILTKSNKLVEGLITKIFARLIPIFILGFITNIYQMNLLNNLINVYGGLILWLLALIVIYLIFLVMLGSNFSFSRSFLSIKNLLYPGGLALTTGCSLSTMPWTIEGTAKNLNNPDLAKAIIPATTNIQQVGDCIINAFLCFALYQQFFGHPPELMVWVEFCAVFVLARFATAAVIGGAIFLMIPIYESYLNFNNEMIAIILAFNVILDPIVTSSNVMGNSALCRIFEIVWNYIQSFVTNNIYNFDKKSSSKI